MKRIFFLIVFSVFLKGLGQNPYIRHYTTADGLPSNTVYQIFQDSKKFIWFTTDAGVVKFDGSTFVNYRKKDGLSSNDVVRIKEDSIGRIWLFNYNSSVNYIFQNKIYNESNTSFLRLIKSKGLILDYIRDNRTLSFYNWQCEIFTLDSNNLLFRHKFFTDVEELPLQWNSRESVRVTYIDFIRPENAYRIWTNYGIYLQYKNDSVTNTLNNQIKIESTFPTRNNYFYLKTYNLGLLKIDNSLKFERLELPLNSTKVKYIYEDTEGYLWITAYDDGVYCFKDNKLFKWFNIPRSLGIFEDDNQNIWIGSHSNGVFLIQRESLTQVHREISFFNNKSIEILCKSLSSGVWCSDGYSLYLYDKGKKYDVDLPWKDKTIDMIYQFDKSSIYLVKKNLRIFLIQGLRINNLLNKVEYKDIISYEISTKKILLNDNNDLIIYDQNHLFFSGIDEHFKRIKQYYIGERINNAYFDQARNLVINGKRNYIVKDGKIFYIAELGSLNGSIFIDHINITRSAEVINVDGDNLFLYTNKRLYNFTESFSNSYNSQITKIINNDSSIYFATNSNLFKCDNPFSIIHNVPTLLQPLNVFFHSIYDMVYYDDSLYIASSEGLTILSNHILKDIYKPAPAPYIHSITVNNQPFTSNNENITLVGKKSINILVKCIDFSSSPLLFSYMLQGYDTNWILSTGNKVNVLFNNLPKGNYRLIIRAKKSNSEWSTPIYIDIIIKPTFWQYPLFWVLVVLMLGVLTALTVLKIRSIRMRRIEANHQLVLMEQKALAAMMNPHFIFNSLGSIQNYLLRNKSGQAVTFLSQFSRLIRQNLKAVNVAMIELDQEISRIRNYLELEQLRLEGKFQYIIEVDPAIEDENYFVPSMMIQPFVENSIWHGISTIDIPGFIMLKVTIKSTRAVEVIIQDNGVGMAHTMLNRSKSKNNLHIGMEMTNRRLKLLSAKYKIDASIIVTSLSPHSQYPGTRITLTLPYTVEPKKDPVNKNTQ